MNITPGTLGLPGALIACFIAVSAAFAQVPAEPVDRLLAVVALQNAAQGGGDPGRIAKA